MLDTVKYCALQNDFEDKPMNVPKEMPAIAAGETAALTSAQQLVEMTGSVTARMEDATSKSSMLRV